MNPKPTETLNRKAIFVIIFLIASLIAFVAVLRPLFSIFVSLCAVAGVLAVFAPFWAFALYILLFPFAPYLAYSEIPFITLPKLVFAVALFGFLVAALFKRQKVFISDEIKALAFLVAFAFASLIWSKDKNVGATSAISLFGMVALCALVSNISRDRSRSVALARLLIYQALIFSVFGAIQFVTKKTIANIGYYPDANYFITYRSLVRASSVFLHPNDFSSYLLVTTPLAFVWGVEKKGYESLIGFLTAVAGLFALVLTFTRSAWIALLVAVLLTLARRYWRIFLGLTLVIMLAFGIIFVKYQKGAESLLLRLEASPDRSVSDRTWAYEAGLEMVKSNPLFGVGIGQYVVRYPDFKPYEASWTAKGERVPMTAHNLVLEITSELGILGLTLFFIFLYLFSKRIKKLASSNEPTVRAISLGLGCGLLAFFIQAQFNNQLYMEIAWIASGLLLGVGTLKSDRG